MQLNKRERSETTRGLEKREREIERSSGSVLNRLGRKCGKQPSELLRTSPVPCVHMCPLTWPYVPPAQWEHWANSFFVCDHQLSLQRSKRSGHSSDQICLYQRSRAVPKSRRQNTTEGRLHGLNRLLGEQLQFTSIRQIPALWVPWLYQ